MTECRIVQADRARLDPLTVRIPEAIRLTGIGRSKIYELIQEGRIITVKVGRMTLVRVSSLRELVEPTDADDC
jgi:excisionase family DNA binding protein